MPGITNEHDLTPLFDRELSGKLVAGVPLVPTQPNTPSTVKQRVTDVRRMLDGVSGLGWSVIGFVLGAVFWHFVGFWGFVANVVVSGPVVPSSSAQTLQMAQRGGLVRMAEASAPASSAACTILFLDRQTGLTSARACEGDEPPLPADSFQGREDRAVTTGAEQDAAYDPAR
jgi:hypothetical protein